MQFQMNLAKACDTIVRKFTSYRSRHLKADTTSGAEQREIDALKLAASALVDWKSLTKGRALFKRRNYTEIIRRRDAIMKEDPRISQLGAFQKASKELWQEADPGFLGEGGIRGK